MAVVVLIAFLLPVVGEFVKTCHVLNIGIFLAFLVTGLTLETSGIIRQLKNYHVLTAALMSSLVLIPVLAYYLSRLFFAGRPDFVIGALIIGAAPVTVASGTVMTALALGNVPLSLFICVFGNFASIISIPVMVNLLVGSSGASISLPVIELFLGLFMKVVLPTVIGQILRIRLKDKLGPYKKTFSIFNQCIVLLIILNAVSSSAGKILDVGFPLFALFPFMIFLHALILFINWALTRLLRLDGPSTSAFTIHTSQKTLTISYLVWNGYFAAAYPMALIPGIVYHLTQMIMDTMVAQWFRSRSS
jgi:solute carrier family 10 (sodium/bile acid cotransporter), member 7